MIFHYCNVSIHFKAQPVYISALIIITKIKIFPAVFQQLITEGSTVIFISIGPQVYPDKMKRVRGMIDIFHPLKTIQLMLLIVERHRDRIVYLLLPVPVLSGSRKPVK